MLKRNFVLLGLLVLISLVYVNYKPSENLVDNQNSINNGINLYSITEIDEIKIKLDTEQYIVLNLWASWCTPCIEEVEELKELANNDNYYVIGLLVDDSEKNGKDPEYNCGLRHNKFISYQPYKSGLRMWDGKQLQSIENNIKRLIELRLYFPKFEK